MRPEDQSHARPGAVRKPGKPRSKPCWPFPEVLLDYPLAPPIPKFRRAPRRPQEAPEAPY